MCYIVKIICCSVLHSCKVCLILKIEPHSSFADASSIGGNKL